MKTVKITSEGGVVCGTKIIDTETGAEIPGVYSLTIDMPSRDELVTADLRIMLAEIVIDAHPRFFAEYANSGRRCKREVAKIIWADGGETDFTG